MNATTIDSPTAIRTSRSRDGAVIAGRAMSGLVILFLLLDGAIKLVPVQPVIDTMAALGWPADVATARLLGALTIGSALLYAWPRTSLLGAIVLTAYLGGAVATHARIGSPLFTHTLFGVYIGVLAWAGLYLRTPALRVLLARRD
jgi:hypothetical protein